jgi:hypothetical protein
MEVPKPLIFVANVSNILQNFVLIAIPVALFLLWLDARIYSGLLRRKGELSAAIWAGCMTALLFASLIFVDWAVPTPIKGSQNVPAPMSVPRFDFRCRIP